MIVLSLSKKYKKALPRLEEGKESHEGLTRSLADNLVEKWSKMEATAMEDRGDALTVFDVVEKKGWMFHCDIFTRLT